MKRNNIIIGLITGFTILLICECKKEAESPTTFIPTIAETSLLAFNATSATVEFKITSDGGGQITEKGICWSTSPNPTTTDSKTTEINNDDSYTGYISGLNPMTNYSLRAYAVNSAGIAYGNQVNFLTSELIPPTIFNPQVTYDIVIDVEGIMYKTVQIGTQKWMAENLRTSKLNNGEPIEYKRDLLSKPGYCWFRDDSAKFKNFVGGMYNGWAIESGKLCPTGWHIPSVQEWEILANYLGGPEVAGGKLKESGTTHWNSPNIDASNESGFTALPTGFFRTTFDNLKYEAKWHTSTFNVDYYIYTESVNSDSKILVKSNLTDFGFIDFVPVRCIKDN